LFNLQNVDVLGEFLDFVTADRVDQASLTNTISTNKSVFAASNELQSGVREEFFSTNDKSDSLNLDVENEVVTLLMAHFWDWNFVFIKQEFFDLFI